VCQALLEALEGVVAYVAHLVVRKNQRLELGHAQKLEGLQLTDAILLDAQQVQVEAHLKDGAFEHGRVVSRELIVEDFLLEIKILQVVSDVLEGPVVYEADGILVEVELPHLQRLAKRVVLDAADQIVGQDELVVEHIGDADAQRALCRVGEEARYRR